MDRMARITYFFRVEEETTVIFHKVSLTSNSDSFVSDGRCKQVVPSRIGATSGGGLIAT